MQKCHSMCFWPKSNITKMYIMNCLFHISYSHIRTQSEIYRIVFETLNLDGITTKQNIFGHFVWRRWDCVDFQDMNRCIFSPSIVNICHAFPMTLNFYIYVSVSYMFWSFHFVHDWFLNTLDQKNIYFWWISIVSFYQNVHTISKKKKKQMLKC